MIDPQVEEIRKRRRRILQVHYDGSIDRFVEDATRWSQEHPEKVVDLRKRPPAKSTT
jgi:hypothetical protein